MWSGSDYEFSMAAEHGLRKRRPGLAVAAWFSLIVGVYAVVAVGSILGLLTGGFAGALGGLVAAAVLTDHPPRRTRRVAKVALGLNALALVACAAVVIGFWIAER
jgi:hypothetical protein